MIYEEWDLTEKVEQDYPLNEVKRMNGHNWKMLGGLAIVFIIGGLQALHNIGGLSAWIDMAIPVLLAIEHGFNGRTD